MTCRSNNGGPVETRAPIPLRIGLAALGLAFGAPAVAQGPAPDPARTCNWTKAQPPGRRDHRRPTSAVAAGFRRPCARHPDPSSSGAACAGIRCAPGHEGEAGSRCHRVDGWPQDRADQLVPRNRVGGRRDATAGGGDAAGLCGRRCRRLDPAFGSALRDRSVRAANGRPRRCRNRAAAGDGWAVRWAGVQGEGPDAGHAGRVRALARAIRSAASGWSIWAGMCCAAARASNGAAPAICWRCAAPRPDPVHDPVLTFRLRPV